MSRNSSSPPARSDAGPGVPGPAAWRAVPATPPTWPLLERLFGLRGACGGCWCMTPRLTRSLYEQGQGEGNRQRLRDLVERGERPPGLLLLADERPVGWCSIEPRSVFGALARSRVLAPVDDAEVWSIVCLFVAKEWRGQGVSRRLIRAAVAQAASGGARLVEAYPVEPRTPTVPAPFAYQGIASAYLAEGFREVARRSPTRPILRCRL